MEAPRIAGRAAALLALLASLAAPGCALFPRHPPAPPRPAPGYTRLRDTLASVDASGLAGHRLAIDPGHGGFFRGALGVHGLAEADVNLGVATRLRDLLVRRGAIVLMTREADHDFLTPADSSLRADLAARTSLANAFAPDLFLSIHHNADPRGAHDVNETQTYYKLGDEGPSLDVAQDVHRALVRNVGIRANEVLPGNFFVLRNSQAPAILTETSYITDPDVEERLRLPEKQELEAEALFIGLARYFLRRLPVIEEFLARDLEAPPESGVFVRGDPTLSATVRGSFDGVRLHVDGQAVEPLRSGGHLWWKPALPWSGGEHEARLDVRLGGEGSARGASLAFRVARAWARFDADLLADVNLDAAHPLAALRIRVRDRFGRFLRADGPVRLRRLSGPRVEPAEGTLWLRDGVAWAYLQAPDSATTGVARFQVSAPDSMGEEAPPPAVVLVPVGSVLHLAHGHFPWTGRARLEGVATVPGTSGPEPLVSWLTPDGFAVIPRDSSGAVRVPAPPGYRIWAEDSILPPHFAAIAGGVLFGRRIVLDPEGGGDDAAGQGPGGTRAASLNLESARIVAAFLTAAGAEVKLTRDGDFAVSEMERVRISEEFRAERFLRIAHRTSAPRLACAFSSPSGKAWAERAAGAFADLGLPAPLTGAEAGYALQQTSCPALLASPSSLGSEAAEARVLAPGALRGEAYALYLSFVREWRPPGEPALPDSLTLLDRAGRPVPGAAVTLGGAIVVVTDATGRARFARTEPGPLAAEVVDPRARARVVLLDSQRGATLTGTPDR